MKVLFFGTRNASPKWLEVMRLCVQHAACEQDFSLKDWLESDHLSRVAAFARRELWLVREQTPLRFLHGDGPPGEAKPGKGCPVGVDRLSEVAVVLEAPRHARVLRFPVQQAAGESWAMAAARRNQAMVKQLPDRAYCLHTDLDASKGSTITAGFLKAARLPFWYVRLTPAGKLVSVEERLPA